jgi:hypothetical protein
MPALMSLEGPRVISSVAPWHRNVENISRRFPSLPINGLAGFGDALPWVLVGGIGGLVLGVLAFKKGWVPGEIWGGHQASHAREKAFHGRKSRRKGRR